MAPEPNDYEGDSSTRTQGFGTRPEAYDIPTAVGRQRLGPALDPVARLRVSAAAKWMLVVGILLYILGAPFYYHADQPSDADINVQRQIVSNSSKALDHAKHVAHGDDAVAAIDSREADLAKEKAKLAVFEKAYTAKADAAQRSNLINVIAAAILAAMLATGLPRLLLPAVFGRYHEPVEAVRDWLVVGVMTGGLYLIVLALFKQIKAPEDNDFLQNLISLRDASSANQMFDPIWMKFRLPIILICALIGLVVARRLALRQEGVMAEHAGKAVGELILQALLLGAFARPFERFLAAQGGLHFPAGARMGLPVVVVGVLLIASAFAVIFWAYDADRHAMALHRRGHPALTGVDAGGERPVPMTLSVIGGRDSGKTVFMAAAYYEWLLRPYGQLRIKATKEPMALDPVTAGYAASRGGGGTNLERVADELYGNNQFPVGTVSTQNLPFDLAYGKEAVCQFSMLDFPGGAVVGRAADESIVHQFWERLDNSDALMIIADMSYVRRGRKDPGFTRVFEAYVDAMRRLIDRNGKRRVVPIALVLTKCDEYFDPAIGDLNRAAMQKGLEEFGYSGLESTWRQMCAAAGQPIVEFQTWTTSAITFSEPQLDENGVEDHTRPYKIIPPPPPIAPSGCAAPVLWLTAKVMRWNVTAFRDLSSFVFGASSRQRLRLEAVIEMERAAEESRRPA